MMSKHKYLKILAWLLVGMTIALVLFSNNLAEARSAKHYTELTFAPLPPVTLPEYERYQLQNGLVVYLVEDHELPLISGNALIKTGSRLEIPEKVGLGDLTGMVWRTGGTQMHSAEEINLLLEQLAATIESSIGLTSGSIGFNALSEDLDTVLPLFAEIVRYPAFEPEQLELAKTQIQGDIARRNDQPGEIASREFSKLIYGDQSPYARTVEYNNLDSINREDVQQFYQTYVRPDQMILGIVGDFETSAMKKMIEKTFRDWQVETIPSIIIVPEATQNYQGRVFLVDQPQLTQSNILLGHLGGRLDNPDYPALTVLNGILNGFGGRLFQELRSRQGLAYSVYGLWTARYDYPGIFVAGGQTRSETTVPFIESLLAQIERLRTTSITTKELDYAKDSILNSFVFQFEEASQTLSRLMYYEYYGYREDFIFKYQQGVQATTIEDLQRVAQTYLKPENIVILVVGNKEEIQPPLTNLDTEIKIVDISIPEPA